MLAESQTQSFTITIVVLEDIEKLNVVLFHVSKVYNENEVPSIEKANEQFACALAA